MKFLFIILPLLIVTQGDSLSSSMIKISSKFLTSHSTPLEWKTFSSATYRIKLPVQLSYEWHDKSVQTFDTWNINEKPQVSDYGIDIYSSSPSRNCEEAGIAFLEDHRTENDGSITVWGKAGEFTEYPEGTPMYPNCFITGYWGESLDQGTYKSAYALCSIKGDRGVYICIRQVTDNPTTAQQILESFQWTK